jgi:hypothetical protein
MKCRNWGHFAKECHAQTDTCGTCGENHHTKSCTSSGKTYCVSCKDNSHASWDRKCPEFTRRRAIHDERNPENEMPFYPTDQDWSLTARPPRIPLSERFPQKFAVNSLPYTGSKKPSDTAQSTRSNADGPPRLPPKRRRKATNKGKHRENPNTIRLGRAREEGDLSSTEELEYLSEIEKHNQEYARVDDVITPENPEC